MSLIQYLGKTIIAWLSYNPDFEGFGDDRENKRCYVYPRFICEKDGSYTPIDARNEFPIRGRIEVRIAKGQTAKDVWSQFGSLVFIQINEDVAPSYTSNNYYSLAYNPLYRKNGSQIWIDQFSSKHFYQLIDIDADIDHLKRERTISAPDNSFTTQICLRIDQKIYGPFAFDERGDSWIISPLKENDYQIAEYDAFSFNDDLCIIEDNDNQEAVILLPRSSLNTVEYVAKRDWISDQKLSEVFSEAVIKGEELTRDSSRALKEKIQAYLSNSKTISLSDERIARIEELLDTQTEWESLGKSIVHYSLESDQIRVQIIDDIIKNHFDRIKNQIAEYVEVQQKIEILKQEEQNITKRIEALRSEESDINEQSHSGSLVQQENASLINEREELRKQIKEAVEEIDNLKKLIGDISSAEDKLGSLKIECTEWETKRTNARNDYIRQIEENKDLREQFERTLEDFNSRAKQTAKVLDSKLLERILLGLGGDTVSKEILPFDSKCLDHPSDAKELIKTVEDYIREIAHRNVTTNDVINYLICLSQGFITTFAGEPGTGKTSLCNILAKAMGLVANGEQKRFVDISVERGWTSLKDFIGYYNPLTRSMEKSNLEVFSAFEKMDKECGNEEEEYNSANYAPFVVLLDEANLSPIEHYWAAFLKNCDFSSTTNRTISLGGDCTMRLPNHLRFLATVNFDHTTEELSPRFLDRSWVIMLDPDPTTIDAESEEILYNNSKMIDFASLENAFCTTGGEIEDEAIQGKLEEIVGVFNENKLPIMPRNLRMIRNYCIVACKYMDLDRPSTRLSPIDYAFSQKVLPIINGSGEKYDKLIDSLLKACPEQSMPISNKHLKRMKEVAGNNMGFYQFFAR